MTEIFQGWLCAALFYFPDDVYESEPGGVLAISRESLRINEEIHIREVRVTSAEGEQLGIMLTRDALRMAEEQHLDLVPSHRFMDHCEIHVFRESINEPIAFGQGCPAFEHDILPVITLSKAPQNQRDVVVLLHHRRRDAQMFSGSLQQAGEEFAIIM